MKVKMKIKARAISTSDAKTLRCDDDHDRKPAAVLRLQVPEGQTNGFGILEIVIALLGLGLTIWNNKLFLLWAPIFYLIIGVVTVLAAHTSNLCLVKSSQIFSYLNFVVAVFSLCSHLIFSWGVSRFILVSSDLLILIFSVAVAITSCFCCCKPKQRTVTDLPVNHIVVMDTLDPSAMAQPISSVLYVPPAADGQAPPTLQTNWGLYVPLAKYSAASTTPPPPPTYIQVSAALLPNNHPVPSSPPPPYEDEDLQARR